MVQTDEESHLLRTLVVLDRYIRQYSQLGVQQVVDSVLTTGTSLSPWAGDVSFLRRKLLCLHKGYDCSRIEMKGNYAEARSSDLQRSKLLRIRSQDGLLASVS